MQIYRIFLHLQGKGNHMVAPLESMKAPPTSENGKLAVLTSGRPAFQQHEEHAEGSDTSPSFARAERPCAQDVQTAISTETKKGLRSLAGPRRLRNSDAHKRIAVPQVLCILQERLRPRPKSGKVCRSDTRPRRVSETCETVRG